MGQRSLPEADDDPEQHQRKAKPDAGAINACVDATASAEQGDGAGRIQQNSREHQRKAKTATAVNNVDTGSAKQEGGGADASSSVMAHAHAGWSSELKHLSVLGLGLSINWICWTMKDTVDLAVIGKTVQKLRRPQVTIYCKELSSSSSCPEAVDLAAVVRTSDTVR